MADNTASSLVVASAVVPVPPPRHGRSQLYLGLNALQLVQMLGLLPLVGWAVTTGALSRPRLCARATRPGRPLTYADASVLLLALLARIWHLSYPDVCLWLKQWPALAWACGLPQGQVIHPAHLSRRVRSLGPYPLWRLYLALVSRAIRLGLVRGRDLIIDSTLLPAWGRLDLDAACSFPSGKGRVFGYKVHTVIDRASRLPLFFLLSSANRNDLPFAYPLLWACRFLWRLPVRVVRADGAYWGFHLLHFIVTVIGAHPIIPMNPKRRTANLRRCLACFPLNYSIRALIERFFACAKRYFHLDTSYARGYEAVLIRTCLSFCAILVVALAAEQAGAPELRLSPTRVLAHLLPVQEAA